ncbi:unnamed protein product [Phytomonas sp. Hart1]|nr:unnamed protein product [Phytomonas sp. Hart1]|eukprot:CCW70431.1 unnamed protein product [Phytomonas sp. isolate Hart1]
MALGLAHIRAIVTPRPCNCLLASAGVPTNGKSTNPILAYACYEFSKPKTNVAEVDPEESSRENSNESSSSGAEQSPSGREATEDRAYYGAVGHLEMDSAAVVDDRDGDITHVVVSPSPPAQLPFGVFDVTLMARAVMEPYLSHSPLSGQNDEAEKKNQLNG